MTAGTAHGKVILFGEHAVVYGAPAIAVGIDRGVTASASPAGESGPSTLTIRTRAVPAAEERVDLTVRDDEDVPTARAFRALVEQAREARLFRGAVAVAIESDLPAGAGLGASAALGVAIARALDPHAPPDLAAERAGAWERVFHGNPSGVDAAVAARGGCVYFERGVSGAPPTITPVRVPGPMTICIGNSGQPSSTRSMVEAVGRQHERRPDTTKRTFAAIETLVRNARLAIEAADRKAVGQLLDLNQMLLSGLFVSTPEIEQMCATARTAGALGAKLTGAGGGGCVVALVDTDAVADAVLAAWEVEGFAGFATTFGDRGVAAEHAARGGVQ